jgi:hypothetical protein
MKAPSWRSVLKGNSLQRDLTEIRDLALKYVKEETLDPLKATGRFALFGALGSVFVSLGVGLLLLGVLRFFQEQFAVFRGTLSWIPYLIVAALAVLVIALTLWRVTSGAGPRRIKDKS